MTLASLSFLMREEGEVRPNYGFEMSFVILTSQCTGLSSSPQQKTIVMVIPSSWSQLVHFAFRKEGDYSILLQSWYRMINYTLDIYYCIVIALLLYLAVLHILHRITF